jgi:hypothetical protein
MAAENPTEAVTADHDIRETLAIIQDQSRQMLELLRTLIGLIVPIVGDREGPPLDDLIATLVAQNRDLLTIVRCIQADVAPSPTACPPASARSNTAMVRPAERPGHDEFPQDRGRIQGASRPPLFH